VGDAVGDILGAEGDGDGDGGDGGEGVWGGSMGRG
jgi:hypothetical protein